MAATENLEIVVEVDLASAIGKLEDLQEELGDVAEKIEEVDAVGTDGIGIRTNIDNIDNDLAKLKAKIEAFEAANDIDIDANIDGSGFGGREGSRSAGFAGLARSADDLDFGGFDDTEIYLNKLSRNLRGADHIDLSEVSISRDRDVDVDGGGALRRLKRSASSFLDRFDDTEDLLDRFDIRMSSLHNLLASLVPLLVVFIGVMPAAITALVGLAAAAVGAAAGLASLAGLGALGVGLQDGQFNMDRLSEIGDEIKNDFIDAFAPLAERLAPLFMDAVDALDGFFQSIANQGDALMQLTDEARAFGGFIEEMVPEVLRTFAAFTEGMAPILSDIGEFIESNFSNIMRSLLSLTAQVVPILADMVFIIMDAIPALIQMSKGMAHGARVVLQLVSGFGSLLRMLGLTADEIGILLGFLLPLRTALALINTELLLMAANRIASAIVSLYKYFTAVMIAATGTDTLTVSLISARGAVAALATALVATGIGAIIAGVASLAAGFLGLSDGIGKATSNLKEFDRVANRTKDGFNPYKGSDPPTAGATAAGGLAASGRGGKGSTVINIETTGDSDTDKSNARHVAFLQGRTTGSSN